MSREDFYEVSPADFFYRNKDIAGFSNPTRAIYSAIRELVENSMDACELYSVPPEIYVRVTREDGQSGEG
ncbi:MAG: DNA topoisomerase VI subunit B, partial [Candidatus Bathyarchaeia archaeon]